MKIKNWEGRGPNIRKMRFKNLAKKGINNWRNEGEHWKGRGPNIGEMMIKKWAKKRMRSWRKEDKEL
jgi:hypothetical protein